MRAARPASSRAAVSERRPGGGAAKPGQKVTEYTPDGKVVKEWTTPNVTTATKLSNGNILAASHGDQKVIELDPSGKKVWEFKDAEYHIFRARRR